MKIECKFGPVLFIEATRILSSLSQAKKTGTGVKKKSFSGDAQSET